MEDGDDRTTCTRRAPQAILDYYERSEGANPETAISAFGDSALVEDEGKTHQGRAAISEWLERAAREYQYTRTFLLAESDGTEITVVNRLEGNFPGGIIDLAYRFVLEAERISSLTIRPTGQP